MARVRGLLQSLGFRGTVVFANQGTFLLCAFSTLFVLIISRQ